MGDHAQEGLIAFIIKKINGTPENQNISWVLENQINAFKCFTSNNVWVLVLLYIIGFVGLFFTASLLSKQKNAYWTIFIQTMIFPLSVMIFAVRPIVTTDYTKLTYWTGLSLIIITTTILSKEKFNPVLFIGSKLLTYIISLSLICFKTLL